MEETGKFFDNKSNFYRRKKINHEEEEEEVLKYPPALSKPLLTSLIDKHKSLPPTIKNVIDRTIFAIILLVGFGLILYGGPIATAFMVYGIMFQCSYEIISVPFRKYGIGDIPEIKYIAVHFIFTANFYFGTENLLQYFDIPLINSFKNYTRFISFCFYFFGIIWFVLQLKKGSFRKQFSLLAWIHIIIFTFIVQGHLVMKLLFQGMVWFVLGILVTVINDIMAYIFGKLYGKTPLIKISPKKTWEGFIGAAISTIVITCILAHFLCQIEYFICPVRYEHVDGTMVKIQNCTPHDIYQLSSYEFFGMNIWMYPFIFHALVLAIFGSFLAPFGGFFASGFKRTFKMKDFGDAIPGHGGITDRVDCIIITATFTYIYTTTFFDNHVDKLYSDILHMQISDQVKLFHMLNETLNSNGYFV